MREGGHVWAMCVHNEKNSGGVENHERPTSVHLHHRVEKGPVTVQLQLGIIICCGERGTRSKAMGIRGALYKHEKKRGKDISRKMGRRGAQEFCLLLGLDWLIFLDRTPTPHGVDNGSVKS